MEKRNFHRAIRWVLYLICLFILSASQFLSYDVFFLFGTSGRHLKVKYDAVFPPIIFNSVLQLVPFWWNEQRLNVPSLLCYHCFIRIHLIFVQWIEIAVNICEFMWHVIDFMPLYSWIDVIKSVDIITFYIFAYHFDTAFKSLCVWFFFSLLLCGKTFTNDQSIFVFLFICHLILAFIWVLLVFVFFLNFKL